jgi:YD repeat-containing protein
VFPQRDAAVAYTCPIGEFSPKFPPSPLDNREILKSGGYAEPMEVRATLRKGWSLKQVQDALGRGGEVLQRNALGWTERVRNARGQEIEYRYDSWGRLRQKVLPNGRESLHDCVHLRLGGQPSDTHAHGERADLHGCDGV